MAKKKSDGYLSARESRRISRENRRITNAYEKQRKRRNVPESEYLTTMRDPLNAVEFDILHTYFFTDTGTVKAVDGVSFEVPIGKTVGVVGESGCGKSVTSLSLMQLLQRPQGQVVEGEIRLNLGGKAYDVTKAPNEILQHLRGNTVSMIFQEPMTALNPVFRIGEQINEVIALHDGEGRSEEEIKKRVEDALKTCGLYEMRNWPVSALSFGQKKRVTIASMLALSPKILILDEPTAGQDYYHYTEIMEFLRSLNRSGVTILMITHDMHLMLEYTTHAMVVSGGKLIFDGTSVEALTREEIASQASLKLTSLHELALKCGIEDTQSFIRQYIHHERELRAQEKE